MTDTYARVMGPADEPENRRTTRSRTSRGSGAASGGPAAAEAFGGTPEGPATRSGASRTPAGKLRATAKKPRTSRTTAKRPKTSGATAETLGAAAEGPGTAARASGSARAQGSSAQAQGSAAETTFAGGAAAFMAGPGAPGPHGPGRSGPAGSAIRRRASAETAGAVRYGYRRDRPAGRRRCRLGAAGPALRPGRPARLGRLLPAGGLHPRRGRTGNRGGSAARRGWLELALRGFGRACARLRGAERHGHQSHHRGFRRQARRASADRFRTSRFMVPGRAGRSQ